MGIPIALHPPGGSKGVGRWPIGFRSRIPARRCPPLEAMMSTSDPNRARRRLSGRRPGGPALPEAGGRRISLFALAGLLGLFLSGCTSVEEPSRHPTEETIAAPVPAPAPPPQENPLNDLLKHFGDRRSKLVVAGVAGLMLATLAGVGVRKVLRGTPLGRESSAGDWERPQSPESINRS